MGVALTATSLSFSYAWYASGTTLQVDEINIGIKAERSLVLSTSLDGQFVSDLNNADLKQTGLFTPVSTCFASTWEGEETPRFYDISHSMVGLHGVPPIYEADPNGYFTQDLYVQADDDVIVTIDPELTHADYNETLNRAYAAKLVADEGKNDPHYTEDEYFERLCGIKYCARMSLLVDGEYVIYDPNPTEGETVYYGGPLDNNNDRVYDFYQDPDDGEFYEVFYGETADRSKLTYQEPNLEDVFPEGECTAFTAGHSAGVHVLDYESSKPFIKTEPRLLPEQFTPEEVPFSFELDAYTPKKVTVSFYLEGWDRDSVNGAMGSSFDIKLAFKIFRER